MGTDVGVGGGDNDCSGGSTTSDGRRAGATRRTVVLVGVVGGVGSGSDGISGASCSSSNGGIIDNHAGDWNSNRVMRSRLRSSNKLYTVAVK